MKKIRKNIKIKTKVNQQKKTKRQIMLLINTPLSHFFQIKLDLIFIFPALLFFKEKITEISNNHQRFQIKTKIIALNQVLLLTTYTMSSKTLIEDITQRTISQ